MTCTRLKMRLDPALGCTSETEYRVSIQEVLGSISSTKRVIKGVNQDIIFFYQLFLLVCEVNKQEAEKEVLVGDKTPGQGRK